MANAGSALSWKLNGFALVKDAFHAVQVCRCLCRIFLRNMQPWLYAYQVFSAPGLLEASFHRIKGDWACLGSVARNNLMDNNVYGDSSSVNAM
ncbi:MAG: hypothetical protein WHU54_02225 [Candidatus Bathyarchaeia archaeon]